MLQSVLLVMVGGALGAAARYLLTHFSSNLTQHHGFPYGTLLVNVLGSLAVGYILTWSADHTHDHCGAPAVVDLTTRGSSLWPR